MYAISSFLNDVCFCPFIVGRLHNNFNWDSYIVPMTYKVVLLFTLTF